MSGVTATVELGGWKLTYVRGALFRELRELAEYLERQAHEAFEPSLQDGADDRNMAGEDAEATVRILIGQLADVLDVVGWDVRGDGAILVQDEHDRRVALAERAGEES